MKKILIDLERLRYPNSGLANVFRNLSKGLQTVKTTNQFFFFGEENSLQNIAPQNAVVKWKRWFRYWYNFGKNYDIIHSSNQLSSYFHKKHKSTTKILTLHDLNFLHENLSESKRNRMLKRVNNNLKNTDYLVCISNFVKEDVLKNKEILRFENVKEIVVIHNGIEFPANRAYDLGQFSHLKNTNYILNIGVLFDKKKQKKLVEMLPYLNTDLVLVSSIEKEPYANEVRNRIAELGLKDRVHLLKNISEEEKYALIQNAEAMCHPSIAEGFGIPPIEAMAFGKPVFLSTFTSLPEIGGNFAFYFNDFQPEKMANTYLEGMKKYKEDKSLAENIKKWALQFDYRRMAKNYNKLYERI